MPGEPAPGVGTMGVPVSDQDRELEFYRGTLVLGKPYEIHRVPKLG